MSRSTYTNLDANVPVQHSEYHNVLRPRPVSRAELSSVESRRHSHCVSLLLGEPCQPFLRRTTALTSTPKLSQWLAVLSGINSSRGKSDSGMLPVHGIHSPVRTTRRTNLPVEDGLILTLFDSSPSSTIARGRNATAGSRPVGIGVSLK